MPRCPTTPVSAPRAVDRERLHETAGRYLSASPRPFLRWAGSKRALLRHLVAALPSTYGTYWEPFLGSGSLFFLLEPQDAVLGDTCAELVETYEAVRDHPEVILSWLSDKKPDRDYFYHLREHRAPSHILRAAEFIYLNKTCWNGLYRVNSKGVFNVPFGRPKTDTITDPDLIRACSRTLQSANLRIGDFATSLAGVAPGDLVFLDPPYVTSHDNNGFIDYNERLFSWADQERLAKLTHELVAQGVHVLVTNAHHTDVVALYEGLCIVELSRYSTLAGTPRFRRPVTEILITNPAA